MIASAQQLAAFLKLNRIALTPGRLSEADDLVDGEIGLAIPGRELHVQVGMGYANVVEEHADNTFTFHESVASKAALLTQIQQVVADATAP